MARANLSEVMMIRNEYLGYEVGVELGAMERNPLVSLDWSLNALERGPEGPKNDLYGGLQTDSLEVGFVASSGLEFWSS